MVGWVSVPRRLAWGVLFALGICGAAQGEESLAPPAQVTESDPQLVPLLRQAETLLAEHRPAEAYALLAPHEIDLGGTAYYDYLLGIASLDVGHPRDAIFALERVLAAQPDFAGARMELARAHFEAGDFPAARAQFKYLLTQSPPPQTRAVIERYLGAMGGSSQFAGSHWNAQVQLGGGYDSNANGSTSEQTFLGFTLNSRNVATASSFAELTLAAGNTLALGAESGLVSSVQVSHRANPEASFIDQTVIDAGTSYVLAHGPVRFTSAIDAYGGWLDGKRYDNGGNLDVSLSRRSAGDLEWGADVRAGIQQYEQDSLRVLDVDRYLGGLSLTRLNIGTHSGRAGLTLLAGRDEARHPDSPYDADRYGARVSTSWLLRPQASFYAEVSGQSVDYRGAGFFGSARRDHEYSALVAVDFQNWPAAGWSITPRVRYIKNNSDVSLYGYDRVEAVVYVRRSF